MKLIKSKSVFVCWSRVVYKSAVWTEKVSTFFCVQIEQLQGIICEIKH